MNVLAGPRGDPRAAGMATGEVEPDHGLQIPDPDPDLDEPQPQRVDRRLVRVHQWLLLFQPLAVNLPKLPESAGRLRGWHIATIICSRKAPTAHVLVCGEPYPWPSTKGRDHESA